MSIDPLDNILILLGIIFGACFFLKGFFFTGHLPHRCFSQPHSLQLSMSVLPAVYITLTPFLSSFALSTDNLSGSIDEPLEDGDTALHLCCLYGYLPCVKVGNLELWLPSFC